eukprot:CAMPEP_0180100798 /NCGR_PEP_ID=MMETSP0985-20121206/29123_1 /TAXON_ID=483367 /ORGANISM="non described non described, Strain CCMP 2436" /LENGTH=75 /DNA_ID=CAMNT_0022036623 /DNA_START=77 /DNA_END=301 /DNA_ORIENTATION=+
MSPRSACSAHSASSSARSYSPGLAQAALAASRSSDGRPGCASTPSAASDAAVAATATIWMRRFVASCAAGSAAGS